jgi:hypothetical protein
MDQEKLEIELGALAAHLHERRAAILAAWSRVAQSDPKLTTSITLSRVQFYDHMPGMLDALERKLQSTNFRDKLSATHDEATNAEGHGLQRWQQGYKSGRSCESGSGSMNVSPMSSRTTPRAGRSLRQKWCPRRGA